MNDLIDWKQIKKDYDNGLTDAEMAEKYGINKDTVRVHRNRSKWGKANPAKRVRKKRKSVTTNKRNVTKRVTAKRNVTNKRNVTEQDDNTIASAQGLSDRERLFCQYYIKSYNAVQSYINAYDCDYETARSRSYKLVAKVGIKRYLSDLKKRQSERLMISADDVLMNYIKQMKANIGDYIDFRTAKKMRVDANGKPIADADGQPIYDYNTEVWLRDKSKMDLSLVNEIQNGRDGISVKLPDKQKAMAEILKHLDNADKNKLANDKLRVEVEMIKAKLKIINNDDNEAMEQANKTLDAIIGSIKKGGDHDEK